MAPGAPISTASPATAVAGGTGSQYSSTETTAGMPVKTPNGTDYTPPGGLWGGQVGGKVMAQSGFNPDLTIADWLAQAGMMIATLPEGGLGAEVEAAAEGGGTLYRIVDGVRRAKAAEMLGARTISAEVQVGGRIVQRLELSLDVLRSSKGVIDASTPAAAARFSRVLEGTRVVLGCRRSW